MIMMSGMSGMGSMRGLSSVKALTPMDDLAGQEAALDRRAAGWAQQVGVERAQEAVMLARQDRMRRTLPELLAELWLMKRGVQYVAQWDLGWARPDFTLFDVPASAPGAMVWEINGEYWHRDTAAYDAARKQRLLATTIRAQQVMKVIEVWESDIYRGDAAFEVALAGHVTRGAA